MYVTQQDLIDRGWGQELIELTDKLNTPVAAINETIVAAHIGDAVSLIDGFLAKRYTLPLGMVPSALTKIAADIARFNLHGDNATKDSPVERNYQAAMKWLRDVASGLVVIDDAGVVPTAAGGGQIQTSTPNRVFTRDSLRGF